VAKIPPTHECLIFNSPNKRPCHGFQRQWQSGQIAESREQHEFELFRTRFTRPPSCSAASTIHLGTPGMAERTVIHRRRFSKSFSMTGWRLDTRCAEAGNRRGPCLNDGAEQPSRYGRSFQQVGWWGRKRKPLPDDTNAGSAMGKRTNADRLSETSIDSGFASAPSPTAPVFFLASRVISKKRASAEEWCGGCCRGSSGVAGKTWACGVRAPRV